jgi:hypothetical protein
MVRLLQEEDYEFDIASNGARTISNVISSGSYEPVS